MDPKVVELAQAMIKRAEKEGVKMKTPRTKPSSLHQIIKTPEQARRFERMLDYVSKHGDF